MNAWSVMFSSGILTEKPGIITSDALSSLYYKLVGDINKTASFIVGPGSPIEGGNALYTISNYDNDKSYAVSIAGAAVTISGNTFLAADSPAGTNQMVELSITSGGITTVDYKNIIWVAA